MESIARAGSSTGNVCIGRGLNNWVKRGDGSRCLASSAVLCLWGFFVRGIICYL